MPPRRKRDGLRLPLTGLNRTQRVPALWHGRLVCGSDAPVASARIIAQRLARVLQKRGPATRISNGRYFYWPPIRGFRQSGPDVALLLRAEIRGQGG